MAWQALIPGAVNLVSGLLGAGASAGDRGRAEDLQAEAARTLTQLSPPELEKLKAHLKQVEILKGPEAAQEEYQQIANNYYDQVQSDPTLKAKQMEHMALLEDVSKRGMTESEEAQKNALMRQLAGSQSAAAKDIERQMQQKGTATSGSALLAKLQAQQNAQNTASQQADALLAELFQRKLGASGSMADLAGSMNKEQYDQAMNLGKAKQGIDEMNTKLRADTQARNIAARNLASQQDWTNRQKMMAGNVDIANEQAMQNVGAVQTDYENRTGKANRDYASLLKQADAAKARGERTAAEISNVGDILTSGLKAYKPGDDTKEEESTISKYKKFGSNIIP